MEGERKSYRYLISGRVQGVGFRYFVFREAQALGLVGFVRNLRDGRVEVVAAGPEGKLARLEALLWRGPMMANVKMVEIEPTDPPEVETFSIAHSTRL
ncbi:MAG: acylphosphatase [Thermoanaerobaculaceae bacterium]